MPVQSQNAVPPPSAASPVWLPVRALVSAASTRLPLLTSISAGSATGAVCGPGTDVTLARGEPVGGLTLASSSRADGILKA